jgi:HEXXH motif-containing protein
VLLFGLSSNEGLTRNSGEARYDSPVRADKRPIDGIFHACFVTTRVHLAMKRLLDSGSLAEHESELAIESCQHNEKAGRESLAVLARHAEPTTLGKAILRELEDYWADQPGRVT